MTDARRRTDACEFLDGFAHELRAKGVDVRASSPAFPSCIRRFFRSACDLSAPATDGEFSILADMRRDGLSDYIVYSVPFADAKENQRRQGWACRRSTTAWRCMSATWPSAIVVVRFRARRRCFGRFLGSFLLKGVALEQEIFVPAD